MGRSKDHVTHFGSFSPGFNAQLPPFVQAQIPFVLTRDAFMIDWREAHWLRSPRGCAGQYDNIGDDGTSVVTEAVRTSCSNQTDLAQRYMLSDPKGINMHMAVQKLFKRKPSELVVKSLGAPARWRRSTH
ncbi:hypothetical protein WJX77_002937 [Trebouxia sp. C0004]